MEVHNTVAVTPKWRCTTPLLLHHHPGSEWWCDNHGVVHLHRTAFVVHVDTVVGGAVAGTDDAGTLDSNQSYSWVVDNTPSVVTFGIAPLNPTAAVAQFTVLCTDATP